jgi:ribosomal protein S18 acetylase RimI-like enzyme
LLAAEKLRAQEWREVEILETYEGPYDAAEFTGLTFECRAGDGAFIEKIATLAKEVFIHDRHHVDPLVNKEDADSFKADWVRKAIGEAGRRRCFAVLDHRKDVDGFLICFRIGTKLVIDLIGVKQEVRGHGIAAMLINDAAYHMKTTELRAGTQDTNIGAKKLYESLGMSVVQRERTFHR